LSQQHLALAISRLYCIAFILNGIICRLPADEVQPHRDSESLKIEAKLNKQSYLLGEPIVVTLTLTNTGAEPKQEVWFSYDNGFYIEVANSEEKHMSLAGLQSDGQQLVTLWSKNLKPSEIVTTSFDIVLADIIQASPFFLRGEATLIRRDSVEASFVLVPDTYSLLVRQDYPVDWWSYEPKDRRQYTSKSSFQVREPTDRAKTAFELFKLHPLNGKFPRDPDRPARSQAAAIAAYRELIEKYSDTPYAPYAQYYIGRILQVQQKYSQAVTAYQATLQKHPDFPLKADLLYYLAFCHARAGNKDKAQEVLTTFKKEFPNHLVAPNIRYLEKISRVEALEQELKQ
jgi:tetratricopeptide (TPR) repeat protein